MGVHVLEGGGFARSAAHLSILQSAFKSGQFYLQGSATSVWWDGPYFHPKEFQTGEINIDLIDQLRGHDSSAASTCDAPGALESSAILLPAVRR